MWTRFVQWVITCKRMMSFLKRTPQVFRLLMFEKATKIPFSMLRQPRILLHKSQTKNSRFLSSTSAVPSTDVPTHDSPTSDVQLIVLRCGPPVPASLETSS
ncbi:hypothetical protein AVEN_133665-1 [Araneus ventricosus]|uniref:Uncharacterized protein n=1 Tax=Araneus ventricosus TaxID=182803 RepID=A0A4Y2B7K4_ARAVE|nr:hypothetical protein AVEN_133665-1 [Araneus ventricosus]